MFIFGTLSYAYLVDEIRALLAAPLGDLERKTFEDGEFYHRIVAEVAGEDVVLVGGTVSEPETLELFDLGSGLIQAGARSLTIVAPYLSYSTMDRAVKPGEVVKAKTRARLLSSIPHGLQANRLLMLDLHVEGIQFYFEGALQTVHIHAQPVIVAAIRELGGNDFVLACTDAGRAKWVEHLANVLGVSASFVFKRRREDGRPEITAISADVVGRRVVIYDDLVRSGNSLLNAAQAYRDAGAQEIACVTTHGVFPHDALERLRSSGLIRRMICTNSHPRAAMIAAKSAGFVEARSVAGLFQAALKERRD